MEKNKKLLIILAVFVVLLAGAAILYGQLGDDFAPEQLSTQPPQQTEAATQPVETAPEGTQETQPPVYPAMDFTAYDADGNTVNLSDYFGKPIVLNFWASWCGPCKSEMPEFEEKFLELGDEVQFLMVNMTTSSYETYEDAVELIQQEGYTFPVLYDKDGTVASTYQVYSLPTTYFINAEGNLIAKATGAINADLVQQGIDMIKG